jgi:hypothetical protein
MTRKKGGGARPKKVDLIGKKATRETQRATEKGRFDWQKKAAQNNRIRPKPTGFGSKSGLASRQLVRGHASTTTQHQHYRR